MRAAVFNPAAPVTPPPRQAALLEGLQGYGVDLMEIREPGGTSHLPKGIDFAVAGGLRGISQLRQAAGRAGIPVLVVELGYLKRANDNRELEGYYQLGWDRLCDIPDSAPGSDRWERLELEVRDSRLTGDYLLLVDQVGGDTQHGLTSAQLRAWLLRNSELEAARQRLPRVWRPHPKQHLSCKALGGGVRFQDPIRVAVADALERAACVVTYNSTMGLEAVRLGVRTICHPSAHYAEVASGTTQERRAYLERVAYAQWTLEELRSGEAVRYALARKGW